MGTCSGGSAPPPPDAGTGGGQAPMSHPGPVCVSCFLLPPPLRPAGTGPPWSSSSSSPTARGPRPLLFFTPRVPTLTPRLQCCSAPGPPTNLPTSLPNPLPAPCLRFMVGKGSLAAPPMRVPTLRLSTWSLGLDPWGPPCRFPVGLPGARWGTHLPCASLGGPLYPGRWLLSRRQARLGQITNDKQTGHSQRPAPHRTRLKTPNAPKPWGHLSGRLAHETKMEQEPSQKSPPSGSFPDALLGAPGTARPGLVPPLPTAIPRKDAPGRLTDQREQNQLVLGGPDAGLTVRRHLDSFLSLGKRFCFCTSFLQAHHLPKAHCSH